MRMQSEESSAEEKSCGKKSSGTQEKSCSEKNRKESCSQEEEIKAFSLHKKAASKEAAFLFCAMKKNYLGFMTSKPVYFLNTSGITTDPSSC